RDDGRKVSTASGRICGNGAGQDGTRAMIDVLLLGRQHGYEPVRRAVEQGSDPGQLGCGHDPLLAGNGADRAARSGRGAGGGLAEPVRKTTAEFARLRPAADGGSTGGDPVSEAKTALEVASIKQSCKQLHLPTMAGQCLRMAEQAVKEKQSHLTYLDALLEAEVEERERNVVKRRIKEAHFPKVKTLE